MRAFRLKKRNVKNNKVENQRDYIGIENLQKYAPDVWKRYDGKSYNGVFAAELYEKINNKWVKLTIEDTDELIILP